MTVAFNLKIASLVSILLSKFGDPTDISTSSPTYPGQKDCQFFFTEIVDVDNKPYIFEGMDKTGATAMMDKMRSETSANSDKTVSKYTVATANDFTYVEPVDGSVASCQIT